MYNTKFESIFKITSKTFKVYLRNFVDLSSKAIEQQQVEIHCVLLDKPFGIFNFTDWLTPSFHPPTHHPDKTVKINILSLLQASLIICKSFCAFPFFGFMYFFLLISFF